MAETLERFGPTFHRHSLYGEEGPDGQILADHANWGEKGDAVKPWNVGQPRFVELKAREVKVKNDSAVNGSQAVQGLYRIDEKALNALDAKSLAALQAVNALPVAYAQLFSQHRISVLGQLYRLHADFERGDSGQVDVETLFDNDGEDFSFDFGS